MDKVVDHLIVFHGNGEIKDVPGNYTQFREWSKLAENSGDFVNSGKSGKAGTTSPKKSYRNDSRRRMTYKEKTEFEQLEKEIAALEAEQHQIEESLCSGTLSIEELTEKSKRLPLLKDKLDEKSMRWLELSEIED
jgi:ATP-binding cassette subfamily F protein uup